MSGVRFSERSGFDPRPNRLARLRAARLAAGGMLLDLTVSNPTRAGLPYDGEAIRAALSDPRSLTYTPAPFGLPDARAAAAVEVGCPATRCVLTASTSEAYGWLFKLLCDPGDEVLAPRPSYPLFDQLAAYEGVRLRPYPLVYDGAWHIDTAALAEAVGPHTRAMLVVSPNNPTGQVLRRAELKALERLGLPLIVDAVFDDYRLREIADAADPLAASQLAFVLGGLSKSAGLPQMKAGWIAVGGPPAAAEAALHRLELIADTWLSVGAPVQHALPALLRARRRTTDAIVERIRANMSHAFAACAGTPVTVLPADGGWYAVLRMPRLSTDDGWLDDEGWAAALLEEDGVWVQPGFFYDFADDGHLVVGLLTPPADFAEGLRRILARVEARCGAD